MCFWIVAAGANDAGAYEPWPEVNEAGAEENEAGPEAYEAGPEANDDGPATNDWLAPVNA